MKNILIMLLFSSCLIYSQDCKYKKNEVDEFTKNKILETNYEWLGEQTGYTLKKVNESRFLQVRIESFKMLSIHEGSKLMFLTEKEDPITILFPKFDISKRSDSPLKEYYIVESIPLSDDIYERFKNETTTKVRIYTSDGYIEKKIKDKRALKFRELLKCIE